MFGTTTLHFPQFIIIIIIIIIVVVLVVPSVTMLVEIMLYFTKFYPFMTGLAYISSFGNYNTFIQITGDQCVTETKNIADTFATHSEPISNAFCPTVTLPYFVTTYSFPTAPISAAEVSRAIKRLKPSKRVGLGGIP
jgi:hypothetical protein